MKNKKSNSLASELMEDLLEEDLSQVTLDESEAEGINKNRGENESKDQGESQDQDKSRVQGKRNKKASSKKIQKKELDGTETVLLKPSSLKKNIEWRVEDLLIGELADESLTDESIEVISSSKKQEKPKRLSVASEISTRSSSEDQTVTQAPTPLTKVKRLEKPQSITKRATKTTENSTKSSKFSKSTETIKATKSPQAPKTTEDTEAIKPLRTSKKTKIEKEPFSKEEINHDKTLPINSSSHSPLLFHSYPNENQRDITKSSLTSPFLSGAHHLRYSSSSDLSSTDVALVQSQHLKVAQEKILTLESEIDTLRIENEKLTAAGTNLKDRNEELTDQLEKIHKITHEEVDQLTKEKEIISKILKERDEEINKITSEKENLETRLESNFRKIRVRERDLENRLELIKMEHMAVNHRKDEVVLNLKRQVDQLSLELDNFRNKGQSLNKQLNEKKEALQRTVKALRLALLMLESGDVSSKKIS